MHIPPQRRTRILEAHRLRRRGRSLRKIAEQLNVSPATIHADLQLLESNWPDIASPTAQDALLEQLTRLRALADQLTADGPLAPLTHLGYDDNGRHVTLLDRFVTQHPQLITDLHRIHYHAIAAVARELRLTADRILTSARTENADIADIEAAEATDAAREAFPESRRATDPRPGPPRRHPSDASRARSGGSPIDHPNRSTPNLAERIRSPCAHPTRYRARAAQRGSRIPQQTDRRRLRRKPRLPQRAGSRTRRTRPPPRHSSPHPPMTAPADPHPLPAPPSETCAQSPFPLSPR